MKVIETVRNIAEDYFDCPDKERKKRLVEHAMQGAQWLCENGKQSLANLPEELNKRYPVPHGGRCYEEAENVSAFEIGAKWTYDKINK